MDTPVGDVDKTINCSRYLSDDDDPAGGPSPARPIKNPALEGGDSSASKVLFVICIRAP